MASKTRQQSSQAGIEKIVILTMEMELLIVDCISSMALALPIAIIVDIKAGKMLHQISSRNQK